MKHHTQIILILFILLSGCTVNHLSINKAKKNADLITSTAELILSKKLTHFDVDTLTDIDLKDRLKKIKCSYVVVNGLVSYADPDSVVVFGRLGRPVAIVEIFYDYSKRQRNLAVDKYGLILVKDKVYYHKRTWVISYTPTIPFQNDFAINVNISNQLLCELQTDQLRTNSKTADNS